MGIKGLRKLLRAKAPNSANLRVPMSLFAGKRVAVDMMCYLYKYLKAQGADAIPKATIILMATLRKNGVLPFCVFEGKAIPHAKTATKDKRSSNSQRIEKLFQQARNLHDQLGTMQDDDPLPLDLREGFIALFSATCPRHLKSQQRHIHPDKMSRRMLKSRISEELERLQKQSAHLPPDIASKVGEVLDQLGIKHIVAPGEAEAYCAALCKEGKVAAVLSEDCDVLAYGAPRFLSDLSVKDEDWAFYDHAQLLEELGMTGAQFVDLCIMCQCDYNTNVPKIGPVTSFNLIKEYETIESVAAAIGREEDFACLNTETCRAIFQNEGKESELCISLVSDEPDEDTLRAYLLQNKMDLHLDWLMSCWAPIKIHTE